MSTQAVAGFTTGDIHTAIAAAGVGGKVTFGPGTYDSDSLIASVADQTWELDRKAIIKRTAGTTATWIIILTADGLKIRGGTLDGNRYANSVLANGISTSGYSLDIRDTKITSTKHWGINMVAAELIMRDCIVEKTGQAGIFWRVLSGGAVVRGPSINDCLFDRSLTTDYIAAGGIHIQSQDISVRVLGTKLIGNEIILPRGAQYSAVAIELLKTSYAQVLGNRVWGGRIGISLGSANFNSIIGNTVQYVSSYGIELAAKADDNIAVGNTLLGGGTGSALQINDCARNTVGPNTMLGWAKNGANIIRAAQIKQVG